MMWRARATSIACAVLLSCCVVYVARGETLSGNEQTLRDALANDPLLADCKLTKREKAKPKAPILKRLVKPLAPAASAPPPVKKKVVKKKKPAAPVAKVDETLFDVDCPPIVRPPLFSLIPPPDVVPDVPLAAAEPAPAPNEPTPTPPGQPPCECFSYQPINYWYGGGGGGGGGGFIGGGGHGGGGGHSYPPVTNVPEPSTWVLMIAAAGLVYLRRRQAYVA